MSIAKIGMSVVKGITKPAKMLGGKFVQAARATRELTSSGVKPLNLSPKEQADLGKALQKLFSEHKDLSAVLAGDISKARKTYQLMPNGEVKEVIVDGANKAAKKVQEWAIGSSSGKIEPMKDTIRAQWFEEELRHAKNTGTPLRSLREIWKEHCSLDKILEKLFIKLGLKKGTPQRVAISDRISRAVANGEKLSQSDKTLLKMAPDNLKLVAQDASPEEIRVIMPSVTRERIKILV